MKNWRTTLLGLLVSAYPIIDSIIQAYNTGYFTDKTGGQLWLGIGVIVFSVLAKDPKFNNSKNTESLIGGSIPPKSKDEK
jgi:hypothetical protein